MNHRQSSLYCLWMNSLEAALTVRYLTKRFIGEYESNLDLYYKHTVSYNDIRWPIEVLDSCYQVEPNGNGMLCKEAHVKWGDAFVIVYNICDVRTFEVVETQIQQIQKLKTPCSVPIAIIGNKIDLETHRQVSTDDGRDLAAEYGCHFYEVTARGGCNGVTLGFTSLIHEIHSSKRTKTAMRRRSGVTKAISNKVLSAMSTFRTKPPASPRASPKNRSRKMSLQMF
ncbi:ras-related and estrogen-regulated growth inhibitor-like isoform X2 [Ptychodera flava]|uniref:ras-related and estrogen-regulated growth inhibitor-like isoform X2 n=1 Tax=Ptychodera flava TaxID=63121 RepID=UPI00396A1133